MRGAARLARFMPGWRTGMKHDRRASGLRGLGVLESVGSSAHYRRAARLAGFMLGWWASMKHDGRALSGFPGSVVNFRIRERNGAFGLAARVGKRAGERTEQKAEWSGGFRNSAREPQRGSQVLPVWRRSLLRGSQSRQVLATRGGGVRLLCLCLGLECLALTFITVRGKPKLSFF